MAVQTQASAHLQTIATPAMAAEPQSGMTKESVMAFFDRLAPHWDDTLEVDEGKIAAILDAAGVIAGVSVLDVACGTGVLFPFYTARNVKKVAGVDISSEMVRIATQKNRDSRVQVICGDIELLLVTEQYDCCVVYNAFPHFPEPERLIDALSAWLKPNGRLTVAHGMGIESLNRHHRGSAVQVSRGMISTAEMAALFRRRFRVDTAVSDDEMYIVSGVLLPPEGERGE